jgi:hypothetical protein
MYKNQLNKRLIFAGIIAATTMVLFTSASQARCVCRCVNGNMEPICSSSLDIPPVCPATLCGITPPSVRPISPPVIPPIGTRNCRKEQVQNPYTGIYQWKTICR